MATYITPSGVDLTILMLLIQVGLESRKAIEESLTRSTLFLRFGVMHTMLMHPQLLILIILFANSGMYQRLF